ncbi:LWR-salt protein [Halomicrobium salinisoli]|uniref:LWR-salt protein n=1 Tax=Halomicrobium salinisoli TaxID=2878391 RepID=UPI001CEFCEE0|nr:LWR-salt protein [Halomicrobium salinisoli]
MTGAGGGRTPSGARALPDGGSGEGDAGEAAYVFRVTVRLDTGPPGVSVDPTTFETVLERAADPPGEDGWLFFRDNLWRGELADEGHFRELTEEALSAPVADVSFRELRTDEAYLAALKAEIGENLTAFNADGVSEALSKYLGSSIRVA